MAQFKRDLKPLLPQYRQALDALDEEAQSFVGRSFVRLDADAQDALLRQIERGEVQNRWPVDPAAFFKLLVEHCAEGFYSDPGNGGNRDQVAWRMIGFEVTQ
jgi:gluconate 2-dehydrogenase gamma chain